MSLDITPRKPKRVGLALSKYGALVSLGGIAFAFSPVGLAFLFTLPGGNAFSEGGGGGGAIIWGMILTLPIGAITAAIGIALMLTGVIYTLKIKTPASGDGAEARSKVLKDKSISFALLSPVTMLTQPVITFVLGNMIIGPGAAGITIIATTALAAAAITSSLAFAIQSKSQKFQAIMSVLAALFLLGLYFEATSLYMFFEEFNKPVS